METRCNPKQILARIEALFLPILNNAFENRKEVSDQSLTELFTVVAGVLNHEKSCDESKEDKLAHSRTFVERAMQLYIHKEGVDHIPLTTSRFSDFQRGLEEQWHDMRRDLDTPTNVADFYLDLKGIVAAAGCIGFCGSAGAGIGYGVGPRGFLIGAIIGVCIGGLLCYGVAKAITNGAQSIIIPIAS